MSKLVLMCHDQLESLGCEVFHLPFTDVRYNETLFDACGFTDLDFDEDLAILAEFEMETSRKALH